MVAGLAVGGREIQGAPREDAAELAPGENEHDASGRVRELSEDGSLLPVLFHHLLAQGPADRPTDTTPSSHTSWNPLCLRPAWETSSWSCTGITPLE